MEILLLNSDVDNFIITLIVGVTALIFILKWAKDKLESRKPLLTKFLDEEIDGQLDNYTLSFENNELNVKTFGFKAKLISILISLIIIAVPLYEVIETLRPQMFLYFWTCFPNY